MTKEQEEAIKLLENYKEYAKDNAIFKYSFSDIPVAIETILDLAQQLQEENKQKDKMIDEMAKEINEIDRCAFIGDYNCCNSTEECTDEECVNCIKQYFQKKTEEIN